MTGERAPAKARAQSSFSGLVDKATGLPPSRQHEGALHE